jgi:DNA-binding NtrC family response regulator
MKILIVEDEKITRITLANLLRNEGYDVQTADNRKAGVAEVAANDYDLVITDLKLPRKDGIEVLKAAKAKNLTTEVIVMTAYATVETAVSTLKLGAYDYILKPLSPERFLGLIKKIVEYHEVKQENSELKRKLEQFENKQVVGSSESMLKIMDTIKNIAEHSYTVLIQGESGTGKEVIAKALHNNSNRSDKPFVAINCAAIPETLLESELFGYEKGAFSGAYQQHKGYFERANTGTIFIDDIDDMPLHLQVKLLRILQERQLVRVRGSELISVDVRVVCATKVNLEKLIEEKKFREDLYYRLNIIPIYLPPLRERRDDIRELAEHFFDKHGSTHLLKHCTEEFYDHLFNYYWPGNVRQLENTIERIIATKDFSIPSKLGNKMVELKNELLSTTNKMKNGFPPFEQYISECEKNIIDWALDSTEHNISRAAEVLQIPRGTLRSKLKKYGY